MASSGAAAAGDDVSSLRQQLQQAQQQAWQAQDSLREVPLCCVYSCEMLPMMWFPKSAAVAGASCAASGDVLSEVGGNITNDVVSASMPQACRCID